MGIVHIQRKTGKKKWLNFQCSAAAYGFQELGYRIKPFYEKDVYFDTMGITKLTPVVGSIKAVSNALRYLHRLPTLRFGYPYAFRRLMDRNPVPSTLGTVSSLISRGDLNYPIFVSPARDYDVFRSRVISSMEDMLDLDKVSSEEPVNHVQALILKSSHRFYMLDSKCVGSCCIEGDPSIFPDPKVVARMLRLSKDMAQTAYAVDLAIAEFPDRPDVIRYPTLFIGADDVFVMGCQGISVKTYASMLEHRWIELQHISR